MVSSKGRTWLYVGITSFKGKISLTILFLLFSATCFASAAGGGGACPASAPVTGNNCYFVAGNGADTNTGTSESSPWLHAPGMPNCASTCAGVTPAAGNGFIFRGGDTWHFGNSSASPYTGGTWAMDNWSGTGATCLFESTQSGCIYWGVDSTWYSGSSWARPILSGDNPLLGTPGVGQYAASCAYQIGSNNQMVIGMVNSIIDNFELTGLCTSRVNGAYTADTYIVYNGSGISGQGMLIMENLYLHGWTVTSTASTGNNSLACTVIGGGNNGLQSLDRIVIDGSDSNPQTCGWGVFPSFYHFRDSIVRYTTQGVGQWCHDIHDNIFEYMNIPNIPTHGNVLECNADSHGNAPYQPQNTPNVFYNNIFRHDASQFVGSGNPDLWLCPNTMPEYWFNNLMYDLGGEGFSIAGPAGYSGCPNSGGQYMFNNTLVDMTQPCSLNSINNGTHGQYLTVLNEHLINTPYDTFISPGCTGYNNSTNIAMSDATATTQGYTTGSAGTAKANTCANDASTPCVPTSANSSTVGAGANHMAYCTTLASYTSESAIGTDAANACKYGMTDSCTYNTSTHAMVCPAQSAVGRPAKWDAGGYQYAQTQSLQAPQNLTAVVH
jgi:hypothetical protein